VGSAYLGAVMFLPHLGVFGYHAYQRFASGPAEFHLARGPGRSWTVFGGETMILPDADFGWRLSIRHHFGRSETRGADAQRLLAAVLVHVNRSGGADGLVQAAVSEVQHHSASELLRALARDSEITWSVDGPKLQAFDRDHWGERNRPVNRAGLSRFSPVKRLAIEMALHENTEQRAIEGELADLEAAWREAEEIAGIADALLLPSGVEAFISQHRRANARDVPKKR
jgi:hypothetical protein